MSGRLAFVDGRTQRSSRQRALRGLALLTGDVGFSNLLHFPLGTHSGIIVARLPNELPAPRVNQGILEALGALGEEEIRGNLVIIEPGRIRLRRKA
jgi:hypothetical protein